MLLLDSSTCCSRSLLKTVYITWFRRKIKIHLKLMNLIFNPCLVNRRDKRSISRFLLPSDSIQIVLRDLCGQVFSSRWLIHAAECRWKSSSQSIFICSCETKVPCVHPHAVWWGRHPWHLVAVMGGSVGAGRLQSSPPPHTHTLYTKTQMSCLISLYSGSKEIYPSTAVIHFNTRPPSHPSSCYRYTSLWNDITCVLF